MHNNGLCKNLFLFLSTVRENRTWSVSREQLRIINWPLSNSITFNFGWINVKAIDVSQKPTLSLHLIDLQPFTQLSQYIYIYGYYMSTDTDGDAGIHQCIHQMTPGHKLFQPLPSGKRLWSVRTSFFPTAAGLIKARDHYWHWQLWWLPLTPHIH